MAKKKKKSSVTKYAIGAAAIAVVGFGVYSVLGNKSTSKTTEKGQVLNWTLPVDITTVDISKNTDMYSSTIIGNTGSNLLRMDKDGKPVPDLAEKISNSKDGLTYEVTLKDGLKWSDG